MKHIINKTNIFFTFLAVSLYFYPWLDIYISELFFDPEKSFQMKHESTVVFINSSAHFITKLLFLGLGFAMLFILYKKRSVQVKHYIPIIYIASVFIIGGGIISHYVVKETFKRSRPYQVEEFGGNAKFTAPFEIGRECKSNCSFVSGHATVGFMLYALAFVKGIGRREYYIALATILGSILGFARIASGVHFFSDIVFAAVILYLCSYYMALLYIYIMKHITKEEVTCLRI